MGWGTEVQSRAERSEGSGECRPEYSDWLEELRNGPKQLCTMAALESMYVKLVLEACGGNKNRASKVLGIDRRTLYRKLAKMHRLSELETALGHLMTEESKQLRSELCHAKNGAGNLDGGFETDDSKL